MGLFFSVPAAGRVIVRCLFVLARLAGSCLTLLRLFVLDRLAGSFVTLLRLFRFFVRGPFPNFNFLLDLALGLVLSCSPVLVLPFGTSGCVARASRSNSDSDSDKAGLVRNFLLDLALGVKVGASGCVARASRSSSVRNAAYCTSAT